MQMISFSTFWCQNSKKANILKLSLVLPQDTDLLPLQVDQEQEDPTQETIPLGLEERMIFKIEPVLMFFSDMQLNCMSFKEAT